MERGDVPYTKNLLKALGKKKNILDIDCQDPLGRSALVISIENENLEMMQLLLENGIAIKVLLHPNCNRFSFFSWQSIEKQLKF